MRSIRLNDAECVVCGACGVWRVWCVQQQQDGTHSLEVEEIFLERLPRLRLSTFVHDIRVLFVAAALVVLAAVVLPICSSHTCL